MAHISMSEGEIYRDDNLSLAKRINNGINNVFNFIVGLAIVAELAVMFGNVLARVIFNTSFQWSEEFGQLTLAVIAFIGGAVALSRGEHVSVEIFLKYLPERWCPAIQVSANWVIVGICLVGAVIGAETATTTINNKTAILGISEACFTVTMVVGLLLMVYYGMQRIWKYERKIALISGAILLALFLVAYFTQPFWAGYLGDYTVLIITLIFFFLFLLAGVPIGFVLTAGSMIYIFISGKVAVTAASIAMQNGVANFVLLAIPFFILTGFLMTDGGLSQRLIHFVMSLVGRVRGGLLHVIIVVTYIVSGLSGSKVADVTAVGSTMNETLKKEGYDPGETAAVLASAAVMGETVPPCMNMLVLGSITTLSIGTLFMAGLLPAVVMAIVLMILIAIRAKMADMPVGSKVPIGEIVRRFLIALPAMVAPILLISGIVTGFGTPTEISSTAVIYSLILGLIFYREIKVKDLWHIVVETASKTGLVLFIVAAANAFSWSLTLAQVPAEIGQLLINLHSPVLFMIATIIVLVIMGAMLEGMPALLIFGPLLLPIAPQFGINPLQFGIVLVLAMGLGNFLPPIGVGAYVCISVSQTTLEDLMHHMLPYIIALFIGILIVALVPWFSLVVPHALGLI